MSYVIHGIMEYFMTCHEYSHSSWWSPLWIDARKDRRFIESEIGQLPGPEDGSKYRWTANSSGWTASLTANHYDCYIIIPYGSKMITFLGSGTGVWWLGFFLYLLRQWPLIHRDCYHLCWGRPRGCHDLHVAKRHSWDSLAPCTVLLLNTPWFWRMKLLFSTYWCLVGNEGMIHNNYE